MSEKIVVLSDKEKARKKINVWNGSASNWINMVKELSGNSLDIFEKIKLKTEKDITQEIKIIIHNKNKIEFIDSATGIPVEEIASDGKPNYEAIFEVPFAGSNYEDEVATVGTNGLFLWSLAMTCEDIEFFIARPNNNIYNIAYHKGDRVKDLNIIGKSDKTYTRIIFSLDEEVWDNPNFTFEEIKSIVKGQSSLSNVRITLEDKENNLKEEYYYKNGIDEYFNELTKNKTLLTDNINISKELDYVIKDKQLDVFDKEVVNEILDKINCNIIFNFSNDSEEVIQKDFLNTADLIQHGTIQDGIILGFKNAIHKWLKDNGKYDKKDKVITLDDVATSLNYICNLKSLKAKYVSQVKQQTLEPHYKIVMKNIIEEFCNTYFNENVLRASQICNQVLINSRVRTKSEASRLNLKKELERNVNTATTRPKKFTPCVSKDKTKRRLALMEGNSALTPILKSRDKRYLALYALKGKIIGCIKNDIDDILKNQEVKDIFSILGCGMEYKGKAIKGIKRYNEADLQYEEIDIMSDFDADGVGHIAPLVICMFYVLAPQIIENGHLYILNTPLYGIKYKKETYYAYSDAEKDEIIKKYNMDNTREVFRYKGLGSLSTQNLIDTAMNEENCVKDKVTMENAETCYEAMMLCFSDDKKDERKLILETRGDEFTDMMEVQ